MNSQKGQILIQKILNSLKTKQVQMLKRLLMMTSQRLAQSKKVQFLIITLKLSAMTWTATSGTANALKAVSVMKAQVDAEQIDVEATEKGLNAVGKALNDFAKVDISRVIDTSTVQGKLLADSLGEGGYVDSKATITWPDVDNL